MKFGSVINSEPGDLGLPEANVTFDQDSKTTFQAWVGAGSFDRQNLKNFFPPGTDDELRYYATQFNSIEFHAADNQICSPEQFKRWAAAVPPDFKFFPMLSKWISHLERLKDVGEQTREFVANASALGNNLGMCWLQMPDSFGPKHIGQLRDFVKAWNYRTPLAIELRHTDWFNDPLVSRELYKILEDNNIANIIIDTAGRRDLLHMRLTIPTAFIRWFGCNHQADYQRLNDWVDQIARWKSSGLRELYFFIHENKAEKTPQLAAYFIRRLNEKTGTSIPVPKVLKLI